jgi:type VI secretion system protein ImpL
LAWNVRKGVVEWFKRSVLQMAPSRVQVDVNMSAKQTAIPMGPVGKEFAGFGRLVIPRDKADPLLDTYLKQLSKVRTRLNQLKNQGDPGPGSLKLMRKPSMATAPKWPKPCALSTSRC